MEKQDIILAAMSVARGGAYSPVQVQKLFFLIDREASKLVNGPFFNFQAYNYGPYDKDVYYDIERLAVDGLVRIGKDWNWNVYSLTEQGQKEGEEKYNNLSDAAKDYLKRASDFVRGLEFSQLVSAIYKAYPEMRQNSVFQG